jgi:hypothetical protein
LELVNDADETANKVFANARQVINNYDLKINGLTAIGADNTNVNVGENHSVFSLFRDELSDIYMGNITLTS